MAELRGLWPRIRSAARFALKALVSMRQRALLALLGIAIGVAAVVTLVALGQGLERQAQDDFKLMGTQVIDVNLVDPDVRLVKGKQLTPAHARKRLSWDALVSAVAALPEVELVSTEVSLSCPGVTAQQSMVSAVEPELARILGLKLSSGRFIHELDGHDLWVVLGAKTAQQLVANEQSIEPGTTLTLCGRTLRLAGVLAPDNISAEVASISLDDGMLVSTQAGQRMEPQAIPNHLVLRVRPDISPVEFSSQLAAHINALTGQTAQINTARQVLEFRRNQAQTTTRFLAALSSLSLLVGSLGILNVMLMSVLERRSEIGLRMAIGADDLDIGLQFLAESALLGLAGGFIGLVLGLVAAWVTAAVVHLPFVVTTSGMALAFGISLFVGVAAGLYPALKAAHLLPVQALQSSR
jgi:putative ABC transport system permease protein